MNVLPQCDCCQPACCDVCSPPCPPTPSRKLKGEPQNKKQPVCSVKNCTIFGTHDTNPFPEYPCPARRIKIKNENRNSLGSPIGMVASNVNFKTEGKPSDIGQARYATYLKAFARLHLNAETTWSSILIDDIMKEGLLLYTTSEKEENKLESPPDIYTASEKNILREFEMGGCNFHVELMQKFKLNTSASAELGANGDNAFTAGELTLENLKPALKSFFRQHKYCLLSVGSIYFSIWRSEDAFFVLDVCGRRPNDFQTDKDKGVAMLICLHTLENVRYLITNLSALQISDTISIREMKIVKVTTPSGAVVQRDYGKRIHQYLVVNDDYAYLKAGLHLTLNKADLIRNRSALPVAVTAMVVSKIDHPATWNTKMVDKILCFGVNFCQKCWVKCSATDAIDVTEFPRSFNMGQFLISTELVESKYGGTWRCVPGIKYSELAQAIEKAFKVGDQKLLVQINYQMYAIWKKHGFIYLLDPYRHRILGKDDDPETYEHMEKSATVRMFRSIEVFMNAFNHILLDSNRTAKYKIHVLKVVNIQLIKIKDGQAIVPVEEAKLGVDGEVISINEHICFDEAEDLCQKALGDISDYEDEDLRSDVDEMELKTSSSEAEDNLEEEEGGGVEGEDIEGLESSSSGEEGGGGHKKKAKGGKGGKGKGGKGAKGSKGKKGDKGKKKGGKGGKGKGTNDNEGGKKRKNGEDGADDDSQEKKKKKEENDGEKSKKDGDNKTAIDASANSAAKNDKDGEKKDADGKDDNKSKDGTKGKDDSKTGDKDGDKNNASKDKNDADGDKNKMAKGDEKSQSGKDTDKDGKLDGDKSGKDGKNVNDTDKNKDNDKEKRDSKDKDKDKENDKSKDIDKDKNKDTDKNKLGGRSSLDKDGKHIKDGKDKDRRSGQVRPKTQTDGAEADDENEDGILKGAKRLCSGPNPNEYPGYFKCPTDMAVVGSETGSYESVCKLLQAGFKLANRVLTMTPWGNFVVFRCLGEKGSEEKHYFIFDGCTCNFDRFRHLDLSVGTAGLICFKTMHDVVEYIRHIRKIRSHEKQRSVPKETAYEICRQYC